MRTMDLNYLLYREQASLMRAGAAKSVEARRAHLGLASGYGEAIRKMQRALGAKPTHRRV